MKIAHISDVHFCYPRISAKHFLSKKIIGKINANVKRKNFFVTKYLDQFIGSLLKESVDVLIITGDLTTTAEPKEFALAKHFIEKVLDTGIKVFALPGNHDTYTKKCYKQQLFYHHLDILPTFSSEHLHFEHLCPSWDLILLDNTTINRPFVARGSFEKRHETELHKLLKDCERVVVANHFDLADTTTSHALLQGDILKQMLTEHDGTVLYLHGHTHKTSFTKESDNFYICNSSEVTVRNKFKYHVIDLAIDGFTHKEITYFE